MASIDGDQFLDCHIQSTKLLAEESENDGHTNAIAIKKSGFILPRSGYNKPPTMFHRFPDLAYELRKSIWQSASCFPRELHAHFTGSCNVDEWQYSSDIRFSISISKIPGVLHACYESRNEALKFYKIGHYYDDRDRLIISYFNYQLDSLSISCDALLVDPTDPSERVNMDIEKIIKRLTQRSHDHQLQHLSVFENIRSLSFSLREENLEWLGSDNASQYASTLEYLPSLYNLNIILPEEGFRKFAKIQRFREEEAREFLGMISWSHNYFEEIYLNIRDLRPVEFVAAVKKEWSSVFGLLRATSSRSQSVVERQISELNFNLLESS